MPDLIAEECRALDRELRSIRREVHARPELAFEERETAALVASRLAGLGLSPVTGVGRTGVIVDLGPADTGSLLLLRADMDALPLDEVPGRVYGSRVPGVMHACGHDAHTAALLGAATMLSRRQSELRGGVRLLFQPAEEIAQGASAVIADGVLDGVEAAVAAHVMAPLPYGGVAVWQGPALCGVDFFEVVFTGRSGHSAQAEDGAGAVAAAARMTLAVGAVGRRVPARGLLVAAVASVDGGRAANVVASRVALRGTLRWAHEEDRDAALAEIDTAMADIESETGTSGQRACPARVQPLRNDAGVAGLVAAAARETGRAEVVDPGLLPFADDFAEVARRVPACYFGVGAGGPQAAPHHDHAFDVDERAIGLTAEILARTALSWRGRRPG